MNGISFVAPVRPVQVQAMQPIADINANWVAIMPFAFGRESSSDLRYNVSRQWWGEREEGIVETINHAKELDLQVMLKPHVWVRGQGWPGDFELQNEKDWQQWEKNYSDYIIHFARIADSLNVDLFCIGTEFRKASVQRPKFWRGLIKKIRSIYSGKLTYAANWDNYKNIEFWSDLDYIGVDAYFPLSEQQTPTVNDLKEQWQPIQRKLKAFSTRQGKPILFTEFGYESIDHTADGHWKYEEQERSINMTAQTKAYQAIFETFWGEPWFAGGFLWKWFDRHEERGGLDDDQFTPQNKPVEDIIRNWYGQSNNHSRPYMDS